MSSPPRLHATSWASDAAAEAYERGRPTYPLEAGRVLRDRLCLGAGSRMADVGAGSGKLTRLLFEHSAGEVVAVEPLAAMRAQLSKACPQVAVVAASAERLPFADGSLDAVSVAQAIHWFSMPEAGMELARVIAPGGRLALVRARPDSDRGWQAQLWGILRRYEQLAARPASLRGWRAALEATELFGRFEVTQVAHEQRLATIGEFDDRFGSISYVLLLEAEARKLLFDELHAAIHAVLARDHEVVLTMTTVIEVARLRQRT